MIFNGGIVNFNVHDLTAFTITVGRVQSARNEARGARDHHRQRDRSVEGNLAPGGRTVGNMTVGGNVGFVTPSIFGPAPGGDLAIDSAGRHGRQTDRRGQPRHTRATEGNVDLSAGAMLGGGLGTGMLAGPSAIIIDPSGTVIDEFTNAPIGAGVILGTDAITVTSYAPDIVVGRCPRRPTESPSAQTRTTAPGSAPS